MYSGTTLTKYSGRVLGTHQKIDKVARKQLGVLINNRRVFPSAKNILMFEGKNGPDAIKRKSPSKDEPWHFYSPFDKDDSKLIELINSHYKLLVKELKENDSERSSFEAAWLAHAIVDGLTPAHHYPYEEKLTELRGGATNESRTSIKKKWVVPGINKRQAIKNNWKVWGPKGLITTHSFFEIGVAILLAPMSYDNVVPSKQDLEMLKRLGMIEWFKNTAKEIAVQDIYDVYYRKGWTPRLALTIRQKLAPAIIKTVVLAWYSALIDAELVKVK